MFEPKCAAVAGSKILQHSQSHQTSRKDRSLQLGVGRKTRQGKANFRIMRLQCGAMGINRDRRRGEEGRRGERRTDESVFLGSLLFVQWRHNSWLVSSFEMGFI